MDPATESALDAMRQRLDTLWGRMSEDDFRRVHAKLFGALLSIETGFKKRFPEAWARYEQEFYGDDT